MIERLRALSGSLIVHLYCGTVAMLENKHDNVRFARIFPKFLPRCTPQRRRVIILVTDASFNLRFVLTVLYPPPLPHGDFQTARQLVLNLPLGVP